MMISSYGRAGLMYSVLPFLSPFRRLALLSLFFFFFFLPVSFFVRFAYGACSFA